MADHDLRQDADGACSGAAAKGHHDPATASVPFAQVGNVPRPALLLLIELEGAPLVSLVASTLEDERRLRLWLSPATRRRLLAAIEHAFDEAAA